MRYAIFIFVMLGCCFVHAQEDRALVNGGESPDKKYRVVIFKSLQEHYPAAVGLISAKTGDELSNDGDMNGGGGYYEFEAAKDSGSTMALWSPDSKFVAIKWCAAKRCRIVLWAYVTDRKATWITPENYMQKILHELNVDSINRFENNTPSRWLSDTELVIDVLGDCIEGDRATGPWKIFHYEVCIDVSTGKIKWIKQISLTNEVG